MRVGSTQLESSRVQMRLARLAVRWRVRGVCGGRQLASTCQWHRNPEHRSLVTLSDSVSAHGILHRLLVRRTHARCQPGPAVVPARAESSGDTCAQDIGCIQNPCGLASEVKVKANLECSSTWDLTDARRKPCAPRADGKARRLGVAVSTQSPA